MTERGNAEKTSYSSQTDGCIVRRLEDFVRSPPGNFLVKECLHIPFVQKKVGWQVVPEKERGIDIFL